MSSEDDDHKLNDIPNTEKYGDVIRNGSYYTHYIIKHLYDMEMKSSKPFSVFTTAGFGDTLFGALANEVFFAVKAKEDKVGYALIRLLEMIMNDNYAGLEDIFNNRTYRQIIDILSVPESDHVKHDSDHNIVRKVWGYKGEDVTISLKPIEIDLWDLNRIDNAAESRVNLEDYTNYLYEFSNQDLASIKKSFKIF